MGGILQDLRGSGALKALWDLRKGSLLDYSLNPVPNPLTTVSPALTWARTRRGFGTYVPRSGNFYLSPGNPASLQLTTGTIFCVAQRHETGGVVFHGLLVKPSAMGLYYNAAAEPRAVVTYDFGGAATRTSTFTANPDGLPRLYAASFQSGFANGSSWYVNGNAFGTFTLTVLSQAGNWYLGYTSDPNSGLGGPVLLAGIVNRVLTPAEHSALYEDWLASGWIADVQHRRGTKHFVQGMSDSEYARQGIVLDTDFRRQPGGLVRDLTGNYPGTVTGVPVPGQDGEGMKFNGTTDNDNLGDVTQMNNVAAYSLGIWVQMPSAGNTNTYKLWSKRNTVNADMERIEVMTNAPGPYTIRQVEGYSAGALASILTTNAPVLRAQQKQHVLFTKSGTSLVIYVDGEPVPATLTGNAVPATTSANLAGYNLFAASQTLTDGFCACTQYSLRTFNRALSAGDVRAEYLRTGAQKLIWQAPGEDCPVSLAASYGVATPNALGGGWQIISGTWKRSEDSLGRKWIECVTAGAVAIPQPNAFGTWIFTCSYAVAGAAIQLTAIQSTDLAGTARYALYTASDAGGRYVAMAKVGVNLFTTPLASPYLAAGIPITYCVNRRPSDGRFTIYAKGGALTNWTLLPPEPGYTNPSIADVTSVTSAFMALQGAAGDKWLAHDPTVPGNPGHPRIYQGVLSPLLGEVG